VFEGASDPSTGAAGNEVGIDLRSEVGQIRVASLLEGISYLLLLLVAMPLKYVWGDPTWVQWLGRSHGALFLLLCFALLRAGANDAWPSRRLLLCFGASFVPFGAFVFEHWLRRRAPRGAA
jgi:integral membrane protein